MTPMRSSHLLLLAGILAFTGCRQPFVRNHHLRFLRLDDFSIEHPVAAPNGTEVYYLSGNTLWKLDITNDSASLMNAGWFEAIALSRDGATLALLGHDLVLGDTTGTILRTLVPAETLGDNPIDVHFSHDGSRVYYSTGGFGGDADYYRVALDGTGREWVSRSPSGLGGFALSASDSVLDYLGDWPDFSPIDDNVVAYSSNWWTGGDVYVVHLSTDSAIGLDCDPYGGASIAYPSWFPDGHKLVFCATDSGHVGSEHYQLWMLDSVEY
jgi:hypothetical protein